MSDYRAVLNQLRLHRRDFESELERVFAHVDEMVDIIEEQAVTIGNNEAVIESLEQEISDLKEEASND